MGLLYAAVAGLCAGALARLVYPGVQNMGLLMTMFLGLGGGLLMGFVGRLTGWYAAGQGAGILASAIGGVIILFLLGRRR